MTKSEAEILRRVREANDSGALKGLGTNPTESTFCSREFRFIKHLYDSGQILWVDYTVGLGAGWILKGRNPLNPVENIVSHA